MPCSDNHLHEWEFRDGNYFDDGKAEMVCKNCGLIDDEASTRRPISPPPQAGPLKLLRTERFKEWVFLHYEGTDFTVRTKPDAILPKFWVQTMESGGPVFAASTLGECEDWIAAALDDILTAEVAGAP